MFGLFSNRRHHCRACGGLFDNACCDQKVRILKLKYDTPVLVCKFCLPKVVESNEKLSSRSTKGPYYKMPLASASSCSSSSTAEDKSHHIRNDQRRGGRRRGRGETKENEVKQILFKEEPSHDQDRRYQENQENKRRQAAAAAQLERQREMNLQSIEQERLAFKERRKMSGMKVIALQEEEEEERSVGQYSVPTRKSRVRGPSPLSDCGSIHDLQFV